VNPDPTWQGLLRPSVRRPTWYAVSALPLGLLGVLVIVFGLIYSGAFAIFGVGFLLFNAVVGFGDRLLALESRRAARLLGIPASGPAPAVEPEPHAGPFRRALARASRPETYRRLLAVLVGGVTGVFVALVALGCWYLVLRGVLELAFVAVWPEALDDAWGGSRTGALVVHVLPGVLAWFAGPALIARACRARAQLFRSLVPARKERTLARVG
jgi:hypothetical protein